jgi:hypothetical protein
MLVCDPYLTAKDSWQWRSDSSHDPSVLLSLHEEQHSTDLVLPSLLGDSGELAIGGRTSDGYPSCIHEPCHT